MSAKLKAVVAGLLAVTVLCLSACAGSEPFRLHIIANSNTSQDQQVKLEVRDAVLKATKDGIEKCNTADETKEYIQKNLGIILETANETLKESGFGYTAKAKVGNYHFPEKSYQGVVYPEGDYEALRIILGEGEGDNWWCVMFPPLCLYEIDEGEDNDAQDIEYTSFFAELIEMLFGK